MKGGSVTDSPSNVGVPRLRAVSPFRLRGGPVEWREWRVVCCPVFGLGPPLHIVLVPRVLFLSLLHCLPSPLLSSSPPLRVCCHSIVGLGLCLCDRVVSLWNGGDGSCWVERRVCVDGYCLHTILL